MEDKIITLGPDEVSWMLQWLMLCEMYYIGRKAIGDPAEVRFCEEYLNNIQRIREKLQHD